MRTIVPFNIPNWLTSGRPNIVLTYRKHLHCISWIFISYFHCTIKIYIYIYNPYIETADRCMGINLTFQNMIDQSKSYSKFNIFEGSNLNITNICPIILIMKPMLKMSSGRITYKYSGNWTHLHSCRWRYKFSVIFLSDFNHVMLPKSSLYLESILNLIYHIIFSSRHYPKCVMERQSWKEMLNII